MSSSCWFATARRHLLTFLAIPITAVVVTGLVAAFESATAEAYAPVKLSNPSFESGWSSNTPATCWELGGVGTGAATVAASSTAHSGSYAAKLTVSALSSSANRKLVIDQRTPGCAPAAVPGHNYTLSAWYQSNTSPLITVYYHNGSGWHYWAQSTKFSTRSNWGTMTYTTGSLPSGADALSFGTTLTSTGWVLVDDAAIIDQSAGASTSSPAPTPTTSSTSPAPTPSLTTSSSTPAPTATATTTPTTSPSPTSTSSPAPSPTSSLTPTSATSTAPSPVGNVIAVSTAAQLTSALSAAAPGETIDIADGTYRGNFTLKASGTADAPIRITGTRKAILDGGSVSGGYVLHLDNANYVQLDGISITDAQKALVLDQSSHDTLTNLDLHYTGDEILLLRNYSCDNVVSNNQVHDSGHTTAGYGEGVYVGLSEGNWSSSSQSRTGGGPDTSDRNQIIGNNIYGTTAENVDIKEGTTGGLIANNTFNATGLSGANYADSWVDIAGNGYTIQNNAGVNPGSALLDGYQTHVILSGWANNNKFIGNTSTVNSTGYGINIQTPSSGNVVYSNNTVSGAAKGLTNINVTP